MVPFQAFVALDHRVRPMRSTLTKSTPTKSTPNRSTGIIRYKVVATQLLSRLSLYKLENFKGISQILVISSYGSVQTHRERKALLYEGYKYLKILSDRAV